MMTNNERKANTTTARTDTTSTAIQQRRATVRFREIATTAAAMILSCAAAAVIPPAPAQFNASCNDDQYHNYINVRKNIAEALVYVRKYRDLVDKSMGLRLLSGGMMQSVYLDTAQRTLFKNHTGWFKFGCTETTNWNTVFAHPVRTQTYSKARPATADGNVRVMRAQQTKFCALVGDLSHAIAHAAGVTKPASSTVPSDAAGAVAVKFRQHCQEVSKVDKALTW